MHVRTRRKNLLSECVLLLFYYGAGKKAIALRAIDARQWPFGLQGKKGLRGYAGNAARSRPAKSIFPLLIQPDQRTKRAALERRSLARKLAGEKSILDAGRQRFAYVHISPPQKSLQRVFLIISVL
ncbi:hypothetical protein [uncultured Mitsuokella sp.]|uniref:hypothetical protein n=1 Tax=uncultured Mitsuokella sp. TaxID=453120 RepID=UPI002601C30C|nr:hypothetical protein [uncultured Mitsuokella sp.]